MFRLILAKALHLHQGSSIRQLLPAAVVKATAASSHSLSTAYCGRLVLCHLSRQQVGPYLPYLQTTGHKFTAYSRSFCSAKITSSTSCVNDQQWSTSGSSNAMNATSRLALSATTSPRSSQSQTSARSAVIDVQLVQLPHASVHAHSCRVLAVWRSWFPANSSSKAAGLQLLSSWPLLQKDCSYYMQQHANYYRVAHYSTSCSSTQSMYVQRLIRSLGRAMPDEAVAELPGIFALLLAKHLNEQQVEKVIRSAVGYATHSGFSGWTAASISQVLDFLEGYQVDIPAAVATNADVLMRKWQPENAIKVVETLKYRLFASPVDIANIMKHPHIIFAPIETVDAAITCFKQRLQCSWDDVRHIALNTPLCLTLRPETIVSKVDWLIGCGFTPASVLQFCKHSPVIKSSVNKTLQPNFDRMLAFMSITAPDENVAKQWVCNCFSMHKRLLTYKFDSPSWHSRLAFWNEHLQPTYGHSTFALGRVLEGRLSQRAAPRFALLGACNLGKPKRMAEVLMPSDDKFVQMLLSVRYTGKQLSCRRLNNNSHQAASLLKQALSQPPYAAALRTLLHQPAASAQLHAALQSDSLDPAQVMPLFVQVYHASPEGQKWLCLERGEGGHL